MLETLFGLARLGRAGAVFGALAPALAVWAMLDYSESRFDGYGYGCTRGFGCGWWFPA